MSVSIFGDGRIEGITGISGLTFNSLEDVEVTGTTDGDTLVYDGTTEKWIRKFDVPISATGGTVTDVEIAGTLYRIHTFSTVGTDDFVVTDVGNIGSRVEYLVVAGGGGGANGNSGTNWSGGGGGAGGYRCSVDGENTGGGLSAESPISVTVGTYPVVVGAGGSATINVASPGSDSTFHTVTSVGGGGAGGVTTTSESGFAFSATGGSTGGYYSTNTSTPTAGQGFKGGAGAGSFSSNDSGGGGGAASVGSNASGGNGGAGGSGVQSSITGTAVYRAGGGGGGRGGNGTPGSGGVGGGGAGSTTGAGESGTPNTGGGGGGGGSGASAGGSGIVIIRYPLEAAA